MAGQESWLGRVLCLLTAATTVFATMLPPRITTPAESVTATVGQTRVVLRCNLDYGDDPVIYRWLKDQRLVTGSIGYGYRTHRQVLLALHAIEPEHAGVYTCEAANEAGVHTASITVTVESSDADQVSATEAPLTDEVLSNVATSLSDVLAEGECHCDTLFMLHANPDAPPEAIAAQANLIHTIASAFISPEMRVSVMTYSDYIDTKLTFSDGVNQCALRDAFKDLSHKLWPTRIQQVLREVFKKFQKPKTACKVVFLPIFGSLGTEGADVITAQHLMKAGIKVFVLEVTDTPLPNVEQMASQRGDGRPYHWRIPLRIWPTIVINMKYMTEELISCPAQEEDIPGECVSAEAACSSDAECLGIGFGCIDGQCQYLECNVRQGTPGCCSDAGQYWCGDVTNHCTGPGTICDGRVQCMNGADESRCWSNPCPSDKIARCQTSTLCLGLMDLCNGEPECPGGEDEDPRFCRSFPCPLDRPFRCRSGKCIPTESLCDGVFKDCAEGEDEDLDYCSQVHVCPSTRPFKCDYGICIPERMVCDSNYNCLDASDELVCGRKTCPADRPFKCQRSGQCIDLTQVCNGVLDGCEDGSDERNCSHFHCPADRSFKCSIGVCIDGWLACDGNDDCGDGSDELNCGNNATATTMRPVEPSCARDEFLCQNGNCIHESSICDGRPHCPGGEDESDCHARPCPASRPYRCSDGTCIISADKCDGVRECGDGSDELNCSGYEGLDEEYTDYEESLYNEIPDTVPERPVLHTPTEATTAVPTSKHDDMDSTHNEDETNIEETPTHSEDSGDFEDVGPVLNDPVPETEPGPADVQTAASSDQGYSGSIHTTPLYAPFLLAPLIVLSLCNVWMR